MNYSRKSLWVLFASLIPLLLQPTAFADETAVQEKETENAEKQEKQKYIRVTRDDNKKATGLETATVRYKYTEGDKEVYVDLIGVVHIGDKSYYDKLNKQFEQYESLLYELVAPEGTTIPKGGRTESGGHPVAALQGGMQSMLELEHQLNCVDYTKENFVHADMSPEEFAKTMKDRGDGWLSMMFRMMGAGMAQQQNNSGTSDVAILMALLSKDRATKLKRVLAGQFENMEGTMAALEGDEGSTIISERNRKAFEVLKKELDSGKKKIGVFYGAGHLVDMDRRLREDFKMEPAGEATWLRAWKID